MNCGKSSPSWTRSTPRPRRRWPPARPRWINLTAQLSGAEAEEHDRRLRAAARQPGPRPPQRGGGPVRRDAAAPLQQEVEAQQQARAASDAEYTRRRGGTPEGRGRTGTVRRRAGPAGGRARGLFPPSGKPSPGSSPKSRCSGWPTKRTSACTRLPWKASRAAPARTTPGCGNSRPSIQAAKAQIEANQLKIAEIERAPRGEPAEDRRRRGGHPHGQRRPDGDRVGLRQAGPGEPHPHRRAGEDERRDGPSGRAPHRCRERTQRYQHQTLGGVPAHRYRGKGPLRAL